MIQKVKKRRDRILQEIQKNKSMKISELAKEMGVSLVSIRRDLQYLEDIGAITREYGKANLVLDYIDNRYYDKTRYRKAIAKRAALLVSDNDVIFINSSELALSILDYINHKRISVITNSALVINRHFDNEVNIVLTGGNVNYPKMSLTGLITQSGIQSTKAFKCFIGLSEKRFGSENITAYINEFVAENTMLQNTLGQKIILYEHDDLGPIELYRFLDNHQIDYVVTDEKEGNASSDYLEERAREVIKVAPLSQRSETKR